MCDYLYTINIYDISTKFGTKHPWANGIQVCSNEEPFNSHKVDNGFFSTLNQHYDNHVFSFLR